MNKGILAICLIACCACFPMNRQAERTVVPAHEFSSAYHRGKADTFTLAHMKDGKLPPAPAELPAVYGDQPSAPAALAPSRAAMGYGQEEFTGDPRFLQKGFRLKKSVGIPSQQIASNGGAVSAKQVMLAGQHPSPPTAALPSPPPGSSAPYHTGQMTANPSLWPDEAQGAFLFNDHRAFQSMDVITIVINEDTKGKKKAETDAESKYSILAGITEFFGVETSKWAANNTSLDPSKLIEANADVKFEGEGEMKRSGTLKAQISAVIMEVFPNGLMRIEGTKIVSIDAEEEIIVLSGLVRQRDIDESNRVDSNRIANMRIDFYGQGLLREHQQPGWGARIFEIIWPF